MRKIFLILTFLMLNLHVIKANDEITYERLINAIAHVESGHNEKAVSPNKKYVGYLQISKVTVDGCNNIVGYKKYTYNDRYDKEKSIEMFYLIQKHYNPNNDIVLAARIWSEGISAIKKKPRITPYVKKVLNLCDTLYSHLDM